MIESVVSSAPSCHAPMVGFTMIGSAYGAERATELEPVESLTGGIRAEAAGGDCGVAAGR